MAFSFLLPEGKNRFVDATFLAAGIPALPPYLGLQARAFKLRFLSLARKGRIIQPQRPLDHFLPLMTEENEAPPGLQDSEIPPLFRQAFIGETISLVYAPIFFKEGVAYDGLGHRPLGRAEEADFEKLPASLPEGFRQVSFLPVICPYCGADLQGEKDTQVLLCRNCDRAWDYSRKELRQITFGTMKSGNEGPFFYLPFWRIKTEIKGWPSKIRRPFSRLNLIPRLSSDKTSPEEDYYWFPAFKLSPSLFLTVSKAINLRQLSEYSLLETLPKGQYYPVTLSGDQAKEGLTVLMADFLKTHPLPRTSQIAVETSDHLLVFIPFHLQGNELVHQGLRLGISRTALHFGRFL